MVKVVNESLERLLKKFNVASDKAEEMRKRLGAVTSVDEDLFKHFYGIVETGKGIEQKPVSSAEANKPSSSRKRSEILSYGAALKYVRTSYPTFDASTIIACVDPIERGSDFFYRVSDIDSEINKQTRFLNRKSERIEQKVKNYRIEKDLDKGNYK